MYFHMLLSEENIIFKARCKIGWIKGEVYGYEKPCPIKIEATLYYKSTQENKILPILSITGEIYTPNGQIREAGQIDEELRKQITEGNLRPNIKQGWTLEKIKKLLEIWYEHHLNHMHSVPEELKDEYKKFVTEYKAKHGRFPPYEAFKAKFGDIYGHRWYYWTLPKDVIEQIYHMFKNGKIIEADKALLTKLIKS